MPDRLTPNSLLAKLDTQPRVRDFLARAVTSGRASHAYLFLGSPGSGKLDAAWALAQALLCGEDGVSGACASCDDCGRVARRTPSGRALLRARIRHGLPYRADARVARGCGARAHPCQG